MDPGRMRRRRMSQPILIVDEALFMRIKMKRQLEKSGYQIIGEGPQWVRSSREV